MNNFRFFRNKNKIYKQATILSGDNYIAYGDPELLKTLSSEKEAIQFFNDILEKIWIDSNK